MTMTGNASPGEYRRWLAAMAAAREARERGDFAEATRLWDEAGAVERGVAARAERERLEGRVSALEGQLRGQHGGARPGAGRPPGS